MSEKSSANIGFENKCGMRHVYCGGIFLLQNIER